MKIPVLDSQSLFQSLREKSYPAQKGYSAFYSSWLGGITTDPRFMTVPIDDHMVHRGDGVFEAFKSVNRKVFLLKAHLERLARSADSISLKLPFTLQEMENIILETLKASGQSEALVRLFCSRGPGGFTTNPYETMGSQLYVMITELKNPAPEKYAQGAKGGVSKIPVKDSWMAQVKSCNYLPNVMMKKEALDRQIDFTVGVDRAGFIAEGSTENVAIVDQDGVLTHPLFDNILRGTTMLRAFELAKAAGIPVQQKNYTLEDFFLAKEMLMIGTTIDVLPVTIFEDKKVGDGKVGPVAQKLKHLLDEEIKSGPYLTAY